MGFWALVSQLVKNLPTVQEIWVRSLCGEDALEQGMATHSSVPAWRIPGTEEPRGLQFMGLQRFRHNWTHLVLILSYFIYKYIYSFKFPWCPSICLLTWSPCLVIISLMLKSSFTKLCLTLCGPMGCSLPGSSVHGISKARILDWVAIFFSNFIYNPLLFTGALMIWQYCGGRGSIL